jgi:hypothetical protein
VYEVSAKSPNAMAAAAVVGSLNVFMPESDELKSLRLALVLLVARTQ